MKLPGIGEIKFIRSEKKPKKAKKPIRFMKKIMVLSMVVILVFTIEEVYHAWTLGQAVDPTLITSVYAFFGSELFVLGWIKVTEEKTKTKEKEVTEDGNSKSDS